MDICEIDESAFPETKTEPHLLYAHRKAIELATKIVDPVFQPDWWRYHYWIVMGGYGYFPYCPWR